MDATLKSNVRWGVTNGLRVAFALSVFVTLEFLVVGALRLQANRSMGAATVVGAVAGLPSGLAMLLALNGLPSHRGGAEIFGAVVGGPLFGAYAAVRYVSD